MSNLNETDLKLFIDAIRHYFLVTTRQDPEITSAYLANGDIEAHDFTGIVSFTGSYTGHIIVSAKARMLRELLLLQHETDFSDDNLLDAVGELTNTLAGNAREALGSALNISVPLKLAGKHGLKARVRQRPYVITLGWNHHRALVCIDMESTPNYPSAAQAV